MVASIPSLRAASFPRLVLRLIALNRRCMRCCSGRTRSGPRRSTGGAELRRPSPRCRVPGTRCPARGRCSRRRRPAGERECPAVPARPVESITRGSSILTTGAAGREPVARIAWRNESSRRVGPREPQRRRILERGPGLNDFDLAAARQGLDAFGEFADIVLVRRRRASRSRRGFSKWMPQASASSASANHAGGMQQRL